MDTTDGTPPESASSGQIGPMAFFVDLALYLSVMFSIREVYFSSLGFMGQWPFLVANNISRCNLENEGQRRYLVGIRAFVNLRT